MVARLLFGISWTFSNKRSMKGPKDEMEWSMSSALAASRGLNSSWPLDQLRFPPEERLRLSGPCRILLIAVLTLILASSDLKKKDNFFKSAVYFSFFVS